MKRKLHPLDLLNTVFLACVSTFFILWPGTEGYVTIADGKFTAFCWLFGGYILCTLLLGLEQCLIGTAKFPAPSAIWKKSSGAQKFVVLYWLLTVISTLLSPYRNEALLGMSRHEGLLTISIYCGTFLCLSATARPKRWLLYLFGLTMTLEAVLCLIQMQGYNPFGLFPEGLSYFDANKSYAGIYLGTIGNADLLGALLCLAIPIFWVGILRLKGILRFSLLLPLILCAMVLVQVNVQAALVGVFAGGLLSLPVVLPKYKKQTVLAVLVILLGGLLLALFRRSTGGTLYELGQVLRGNWDDKFGNGRIYIWKTVLGALPNRLFFGTGPDTMAAAGIVGFAWDNRELGMTLSTMIDTAHNEYLNVAYHQGILALLAWLAALGCSAWKWIRHKSAAAAILGSAVLCYCIQAFFGLSMSPTASLMWVIWGLLEGDCKPIEQTLSPTKKMKGRKK